MLPIRTAIIEKSRYGKNRMLRSVAKLCKLGINIGIGVVTISASSGATRFPMNHADADTLLRHADHAIFGAKQSARNGKLF